MKESIVDRQLRKIFPPIAAAAYDQSLQEEAGTSEHPFLKRTALRVLDTALGGVMGDEDLSRSLELLKGPEYYPIKHFDCIGVEVAQAYNNYYDPRSELVLKKGESYLRLMRLPNLSVNKPITSERIEKALADIAKYIKVNTKKLPQSLLVGISPSDSLADGLKGLLQDYVQSWSGKFLRLDTCKGLVEKFSGSKQPKTA